MAGRWSAVEGADGPLDVSVIVPVYNPGPYLEPCVASLLAQTLPAERWEVVFVDDGSTDGSAGRLDALARTHSHVRVVHQPNSGWPGQPRNRGIDLARGRYVYFVDHDDAIGAEALARLVEFADRCGADVVIGKMAGHGRGVPHLLFLKTRERVTIHDSPIITALSPHKVFRTAFIRERGIRFPEGRRRLEDQVFVLEAYFAADTISILADYTCYVHLTRGDHANAATSLHDPSGRFDPAWYFRWLPEVLDIVERNTVPGAARDRLLRRFASRELIGHVTGWRYLAASPAERDRVAAAAREIAERYMGPGVDAAMGLDGRVAMALLRAGRSAELATWARFLDELAVRLEDASVTATDAGFRIAATAEVCRRGRPLAFERSGPDRLRLALDARLAAALPDAVREIADPPPGVTQVVLRRRRDSAEQLLAAPAGRATIPAAGDSLVRVVDRVMLEVDVATTDAGRGAAPGVWDVLVRTYLGGVHYDVPVRVRAGLGGRRPVLIRGGRLAFGRRGYPRPTRLPARLMGVGATRPGRIALAIVARLRGR